MLFVATLILFTIKISFSLDLRKGDIKKENGFVAMYVCVKSKVKKTFYTFSLSIGKTRIVLVKKS